MKIVYRQDYIDNKLERKHNNVVYLKRKKKKTEQDKLRLLQLETEVQELVIAKETLHTKGCKE